MQDISNFSTILTLIFTIASTLGAAGAIFYSVKQKTYITILKESNDAYKDRNAQLEEQLDRNTKDILELHRRIKDLERLKTPPLQPLVALVTKNHKEVMTAILRNK